jgi:toxin ParE1/3/4
LIPVDLSLAADADVAEILGYGIDTFGRERAEAYVKGFDKTFELIGEHPFSGALRDQFRPPIRSLPHGSHRIYYDVLEDSIVVLRILHKAMDVERHL